MKNRAKANIYGCMGLGGSEERGRANIFGLRSRCGSRGSPWLLHGK